MARSSPPLSQQGIVIGQSDIDMDSDPVDGEYRDFAQIAVQKAEPVHGSASSTNEAFPAKLHFMLSVLECECLDSIVGWEPHHGRCFKIYDHKKFTSEVLPRFFRQTQYASFQRQLNLYQFRRLTAGPDRGSYYHERFLRWRPELAQTLKRRKNKGNGPRKPADPQQEPTFSLMPPVLCPTYSSHNQYQYQGQPQYEHRRPVVAYASGHHSIPGPSPHPPFNVHAGYRQRLEAQGWGVAQEQGQVYEQAQGCGVAQERAQQQGQVPEQRLVISGQGTPTAVWPGTGLGSTLVVQDLEPTPIDLETKSTSRPPLSAHQLNLADLLADNPRIWMDPPSKP